MEITREKIVELLDEKIEKEAKKWGVNNIYTVWARENKEKVLNAFDNGLDPVPVAEIGWRYEDGWDIHSVLYTDGTVHEEIYRM